MNTIVLNLLEAAITLYPANEDGSPIVASPLWLGACANNVTVADRWLKHETRPSGRRYPRRHALVAQYEITLERVWILPLADLKGFIPARGLYVLDLVWTEEETQQWHRETFYGVTINSRSRKTDGVDGGHLEDQVFDAEYVVITSGAAGTTVPAPGTGEISGALPFRVRWVGVDGVYDLYTYDPATHEFAEASPGITTGRATIAYNPSDKSGTFDVVFSGEAESTLRITESGSLEAGEIAVSVPDDSEMPRLDFYYGTSRAASLSQATRRLFVGDFLLDQGALDATQSASRFFFYSNSLLRATLEA